jgi:hypothetical protein
VKFSFIEEHLSQFPVEAACQTLAVSRSGYYAWLDRPESPRSKRRVELAAKIKAVHEQNRRVYGSPRIFQVLKTQGEEVCQNTVAAVMREQEIRAKTKRKFVPRTTDSSHASPVAENVLGRQFQADLPDRKWVVDITYIPTDEGWLYLAGVLDLCSRKIVGWSMAEHLRASCPPTRCRWRWRGDARMPACCTTATGACSTPATITSTCCNRTGWR